MKVMKVFFNDTIFKSILKLILFYPVCTAIGVGFILSYWSLSLFDFSCGCEGEGLLQLILMKSLISIIGSLIFLLICVAILCMTEIMDYMDESTYWYFNDKYSDDPKIQKQFNRVMRDMESNYYNLSTQKKINKYLNKKEI